MDEFKFKSTKDIKIPKRIIDQVIGQDEAVEVVKKAAGQRRHVLLIGEPGTGKSMLGLGLAELLPKEKLVDVLAFPNPNDENQPLVRTVPAGKGRELVMKAKLSSSGLFKNQNLVMFILVLLAMFTPWWVLSYYKNQLGTTAGAIMFTAFFLGGMIFLASFIMFVNLGKRINAPRDNVPKLIVDNYKKKQAPFFDGTGAHAGALLGDVLHDPFQSFSTKQGLYIKSESGIKQKGINEQVDLLMDKHKDKVIRNKKGYEAVHLLKNELFVLGEANGYASPAEVLSSNRYDYKGKIIKLTTFDNKKIVVTPEHKIAVWKNGKINYIEAKDIKEGDEVVAITED